MKLLPVDATDLHAARSIVHQYVQETPLIRSYALEKQLGLRGDRRVWIKDYGWSPVGSFKVLGATNWVSRNLDQIGDRPIVAHSSGNFASGIACAGAQFGKRVIVVMPDNAPQIKFARTRSFGAEVRTFEVATDHLTGARRNMAKEIAEREGGVLASPYDDVHVIAGNGVGGLEITHALKNLNREISTFVCAASGGGLLAGHAIAINESFPDASVIGIEPANADDFYRSKKAGEAVRIERPQSICDGLLSYEVGKTNWPILDALVDQAILATDLETQSAMRWIYENHGLRTEPSGAISIAGALFREEIRQGDGDIVLVISGRNIDESTFQKYISEAAPVSR